MPPKKNTKATSKPSPPEWTAPEDCALLVGQLLHQPISEIVTKLNFLHDTHRNATEAAERLGIVVHQHPKKEAVEKLLGWGEEGKGKGGTKREREDDEKSNGEDNNEEVDMERDASERDDLPTPVTKKAKKNTTALKKTGRRPSHDDGGGQSIAKEEKGRGRPAKKKNQGTEQTVSSDQAVDGGVDPMRDVADNGEGEQGVIGGEDGKEEEKELRRNGMTQLESPPESESEPKETTIEEAGLKKSLARKSSAMPSTKPKLGNKKETRQEENGMEQAESDANPETKEKTVKKPTPKKSPTPARNWTKPAQPKRGKAKEAELEDDSMNQTDSESEPKEKTVKKATPKKTPPAKSKPTAQPKQVKRKEKEPEVEEDSGTNHTESAESAAETKLAEMPTPKKTPAKKSSTTPGPRPRSVATNPRVSPTSPTPNNNPPTPTGSGRPKRAAGLQGEQRRVSSVDDFVRAMDEADAVLGKKK